MVTISRLRSDSRHPLNLYESDMNEGDDGYRDVSDLGVHVKSENSGWWESYIPLLAKGIIAYLL